MRYGRPDPRQGVDDRAARASSTNGVLLAHDQPRRRGNAIPFYVRDRLIEHFRDAHADLDGALRRAHRAGERHFCTGADLRVRPPDAHRSPRARPTWSSAARVAHDAHRLPALMESIQDCEKPVIVALNGTAAGGGAMLTLAADLVIAADTARSSRCSCAAASSPTAGSLYLLPRIVGMHKAKELVFFGDDHRRGRGGRRSAS